MTIIRYDAVACPKDVLRKAWPRYKLLDRLVDELNPRTDWEINNFYKCPIPISKPIVDLAQRIR